MRDWVAMRSRVRHLIETYRIDPPPLDPGEVKEALAFLDWMVADNFTFLGVREYRFVEGRAADTVEGSGLGLLRDPSVRVLRRGGELVLMTPEIRAFLERPQALIISKANVKSRVHRRVHLDYVGVKLFSGEGRLEGELRLIGLFTASAYTSTTAEVPYLRRKVAAVVARAGFDPASHAGRALLNVLESYPRDELFQISGDDLYRFVLEIMNLAERPRIRALPRVDEFDRFVSVLVYLPKDRYDTTARRRIGDFLAGIYGGRNSASYPAYPEGPLARIHYIIGRDEGDTPAVAQETLEQGIAAIVRTWGDSLRDALAERIGGARARALGSRYADAFSGAYREAFGAEAALRDLDILERLSEARPRAVDLYRREGDPTTRLNLKVFSRGAALPLSERVPLLENLGFRVVNERTYRIVPAGAGEAERVWLHDMALERATGAPIDIPAIEGPLEAAILALFRGLAESDGFNRLVRRSGPSAGATSPWSAPSAATCARSVSPSARTTSPAPWPATPTSPETSSGCSTPASIPGRRPPAGRRRRRGSGARSRQALQEVASLDEDRILRRFLNLIGAAIRTNFFQIDPNGLPRATIAFKFECARDRGPARAKTLLRDLGLLAPRRGRAPALRQGGARGPALVRPAAGLSHRGPGAGQGPAGQERRHRAGREPRAASCRSGCRSRATGRPGSRKEPKATRSSSARCSSSRTTSTATGSCRRPTRCGTTATTPISWSPPTRAPPPSRTSPTPSRPRRATGSATPSPPAAARATTTRAWASPRAAPGRR